MSVIKSVIKPIILKAYKYHAGMKLSQLRNIGNSTADKIENAIQGIMKNNLDPEEMNWIDRIEEKRSLLNSSLKKISITDYGAGDPNYNLSENEMYQGVNLETTVGKICSTGSKTYFWSLLLFKLIREFKPLTIVELGTCLGISGSYQASAQKLNNSGQLITLEGAKSLVILAEKTFHELNLDNVHVIGGRFQDNLDAVLNKYKPIDYAFIDGHHDEKATTFYFEKFIPYLTGSSVMVFDDISWSDGMHNAWKTIIKNKKIKISLDLREIGICIFDDLLKGKYNFKIPLFTSMTLYKKKYAGQISA